MAARYYKSLPELEQGYRHREHRSSKGRDSRYTEKKKRRARKRVKAEEFAAKDKQWVRSLAKEFNRTAKTIRI